MNAADTPTLERFAPRTFRFYRHALQLMEASEIPFLVGGAYAFAEYTSIIRHTKDLDLFVRAVDIQRTLEVFAAAGYPTKVVFEHWLGKAFHDGDFVDIIFNSGNAACPIDDSWFEHAPAAEVLGEQVRLMPAEEMIWQKAYIMERERFDGADVIHLIRARGDQLDWPRLVRRFGPHWRVLLSHLVLYGFVYPAEEGQVPAWVVKTLAARLHEPQEPLDAAEPVCRGTLLSRTQYLPDTETWQYADARVEPLGPMTEEQVTRWTDAGR
jgi:hypothetical protein